MLWKLSYNDGSIGLMCVHGCVCVSGRFLMNIQWPNGYGHFQWETVCTRATKALSLLSNLIKIQWHLHLNVLFMHNPVLVLSIIHSKDYVNANFVSGENYFVEPMCAFIPLIRSVWNLCISNKPFILYNTTKIGWIPQFITLM